MTQPVPQSVCDFCSAEGKQFDTKCSKGFLVYQYKRMCDGFQNKDPDNDATVTHLTQ